MRCSIISHAGIPFKNFCPVNFGMPDDDVFSPDGG
jgi:hypothetical protein